MIPSIFAAISGLRNHQAWLDVVANNLSNVNTVSFKASRVLFQDVLSRSLWDASAPDDKHGSANPAQIGLGSLIAAIDPVDSQGNLQATGVQTDLAIQGSGFFVLDGGNGNVFTRDGSFVLDSDGSLIHRVTRLRLKGWTADSSGSIDTTAAPQSLYVRAGQGRPAQESAGLNFGGNLDSRALVGDNTSVAGQFFDSQGNPHGVLVTFTKSASNKWDWAVTSSDPAVTAIGSGTGTITFDSLGKVTGPGIGPLSITLSNGSTSPQPLKLNVSSMLQVAQVSEASLQQEGGYSPGTLSSISIGADGKVQGVYSNGSVSVLGQVGIASFSNPGSLKQIGGNAYEPTSASGSPSFGRPGSEGKGDIRSGFLEMSNVDMAKELTTIILAQRGFQANARVVSAADEMLQELSNIKR